MDRPDKYADTEAVHLYLLTEAARIANSARDLPPEVIGLGEIFIEADNRSNNSRMTLSIAPGILVTLTTSRQAEVRQVLQAIAVRSMREALAENNDLLIGLLVGQARTGHNYFDRFS